MGIYVNPAELAEQKGRPIELLDTYAATIAGLERGEKLCVVARRSGQRVARIIEDAPDFFVSSSQEEVFGCYAIGDEVLAHAYEI